MRTIVIVLAWTLLIAVLVAGGVLVPLLDPALLFLGAIGLVGGTVWILVHLQFLFSANRTVGTVIGYEQDEGCYFPRVEALDRDGSPFQFVSRSGRGTREFRIGQRVSVARNRDLPEDSEIASVWRLLTVPIAVTAISLLMVLGTLMQRG